MCVSSVVGYSTGKLGSKLGSARQCNQSAECCVIHMSPMKGLQLTADHSSGCKRYVTPLPWKKLFWHHLALITGRSSPCTYRKESRGVRTIVSPEARDSAGRVGRCSIRAHVALADGHEELSPQDRGGFNRFTWQGRRDDTTSRMYVSQLVSGSNCTPYAEESKVTPGTRPCTPLYIQVQLTCKLVLLRPLHVPSID